ncbi:MAG: hypothetical protein COB26_04530 [Piscirickettsiaceae bacterium]|nr:MAG: hypothetical protein COB26_04530 [Piscirickettsiaceae bacterium]
MSQQQHILYLSDHYLAFSDVSKGGLDLRFSMTLEEFEVEEKLKDFLNSDTFGNTSVLIDVMGAETKQEHLPHVTGKDRELLLARKTRSMFPAADLVWNQHIKREKTGRKDDVFLLIGITFPPAVKHVLEVFESSKHKVKGIYSVTALQQDLSKALPPCSQSLIISRVLENSKKTKSFRQSFFRNGKLVISRVNNISGAYTDSNEYDQLFDEIERTYQFLQSAKQMEAGSTLKVISLLSEKETKLLFNHKPHYDIDFGYASFGELAEKLDLRLSKPCTSLPEILGNMALAKRIEPHFKPSKLCETHRIDTTKKSLMYGSVFMLLMSVIFSGWLWYDAKLIKSGFDELELSVSNIEERINLLAERVPETDVLPTAMKQSIELFDVIESRSYKPARVLDVISRAYEGFQDLDLTTIVWSVATEQTDGEESNEFFVEKLKTPKKIVITIRPDRTLNTRVVLQRINDFSASLLSQPDIKSVDQDKSAIDIRSSAQLAETFGRERSSLEKAAEFTLIITL